MMEYVEFAAWLEEDYALSGEIAIDLLRSHTNDVFLIRAGEEKYILKLYAPSWHSEAEIRYEIALIDHLANKGLRVANVLRGKDDQALHFMPAPQGQQCAVLFEYADGKKPQPPFSAQLYYGFGQAIAQMHTLSDDFATEYARTPLDLAYLLDKPLDLALPMVASEEDRLLLQEVAHKIRHKITELEARGLDWGPIHGDATLDNLHVTDDGQIVLYDFDSGGHGWRASDLQGWAKNNDEYADKWIAFKQGYTSVRALKQVNLDAAPYLAVAWLIWGIQIDLEQRIARQGEAEIAAYLRTQIDAIRQQARLALEIGYS